MNDTSVNNNAKWHLEGKYVEYCSCDHGCPCEAMAPRHIRKGTATV